MFSSSSLVKLLVFEKHKTGKTNKNSTNTEEQSTVAAICSAILDLNIAMKTNKKQKINKNKP